MNRMHVLAKIVFMALGLYIVINVLPWIVSLGLSMFTMGATVENVGVLLSNIFVMVVFAGLACYVLIGNREGLARYAVGTEESEVSETAVQWIAVAYRLICIVAGVVSLYKCIFMLGSLWSLLKVVEMGGSGAPFRFWSRLVQIATFVPCTVYLLAGAPHFVRWQVKKTLEMCGGDAQSKEQLTDTKPA